VVQVAKKELDLADPWLHTALGASVPRSSHAKSPYQIGDTNQPTPAGRWGAVAV
jgi:hypothetical protein